MALTLEFIDVSESDDFMSDGLDPQTRIHRWEIMMAAVELLRVHLTDGLARALADDGVELQSIERVDGDSCAIVAITETKH